MSVQTIQKRILSDRQQDFGPQDLVTFNISPTDVSILSGKNSYLRCEFTILSDGVPCKASLDYAGGGGYSLISSATLWSGDGATLLENLEEIPALMGTKNFYSKTRGTQNVRNLLEGLTNNDSSISNDPNSQYYDMNTLGLPNFTKVELLLPLKFSGVFYGKVFPIVATQGLQVRLMLNSAVKALKATLPNGFVVQRNRLGGAPQLCDLPFLQNMATNGAPFTNAVGPIVGNVNQQLPQCWELAVDGGHAAALSGAADAALPALQAGTALDTGTTPAAYVITTASSPQAGTGIEFNATIIAAVPPATLPTWSTITITDGGNELYEIGDTITIPAAAIGGGTATNVVFTLDAACFTTGAAFTTLGVKIAGATAVGGFVPGALLIRDNVLASADTLCNLIGQHLYVVTDGGFLIDVAPAGITNITAPAGETYIQFTFAAFTLPGTDTLTTTNHIPVFSAVLDPNLVGSTGCKLSYKVENIQLICESVEPAEQMVAGFMAQASSEGGFSMDIKSYNTLKQNQFKNQVVSQALLPTTAYRAKAVLQHQQIPYENLNSSYYEPVNDNLRQYQYQIKNKNVPNRKVSTDKEYLVDQNSWNVLCDAERTKCLSAAGVAVRRETHPSARFVYGRELAKPSHSFDANTNEIRLTCDWGIPRDTGGDNSQNVTPQFNKLLLTFVPHFRKLTMKTDNVVVVY